MGLAPPRRVLNRKGAYCGLCGTYTGRVTRFHLCESCEAREGRFAHGRDLHCVECGTWLQRLPLRRLATAQKPGKRCAVCEAARERRIRDARENGLAQHRHRILP